MMEGNELRWILLDVPFPFVVWTISKKVTFFLGGGRVTLHHLFPLIPDTDSPCPFDKVIGTGKPDNDYTNTN
jgi:hypothetical protein